MIDVESWSFAIFRFQQHLIVFMSGSTGERPFSDILTSIRYWVIHSISVPSLFIARWLCARTGLAYDLFESPCPKNISQNTVDYRSIELWGTKQDAIGFIQRIHRLENCTLLDDPMTLALYWYQLWSWVTSLAEVSGMSPLVSIPGEYHS